MNTLTVMKELRGEMGLVLADAPLFSGNITRYKVVPDISQVGMFHWPHVIACNGVYTWRAKDILLSNCFCRKSPFKFLSTVTPLHKIQSIYNATASLPETQPEDAYKIFEKICGHPLTDESLVLYAVNTHCPVHIRKPYVPIHEVEMWASITNGPWDTFEEMLEEHLPGLKPNESKVIIEGLQSIVDTPMHSLHRQILNADALLRTNEWRPKNLIMWLCNAYSLLENSRKEGLDSAKEVKSIG